MPEIVSDEYREGYAAFNCGEDDNPYWTDSFERWSEWETGWLDARRNWAELVGIGF